ncbi:MAG: beta-ketoacyl-ACP synthase II [Anaerolineae bacterium]|jgi:3-oxoacyl-[acyl-carrier-protein] synthase II|nr:beta-ketoacyl-ACP synthase II [Anaerolineae bacterium]
MTRRVVVTGLGLVTPLGNNAPDTWANILNGVSGIVPITYFDTTHYLVKIAAQLKNFDPHDYMDRTEVRRHDPYQHYIIAAAREAIASSGFEIKESERQRSSAVVGSSTGGLKSYQEYSAIIHETGNPRKMTPFGIPMLVVNAGSNVVSIMTGACGPSCIPVSACASGADCIGYAFDMIRHGRIDRALAGCGDFPIIDLGIAAFDRIGAMSRDNATPARASRPFDKERSGFVFGEGAAVLVLEELESARRRGATILAEMAGYASTSDAFHRTAPEPEGSGAVEAMKYALEVAGLRPEEVDYINAHGTATELNDVMETRAVKRLFGDHAYRLVMSSTKSMTGHAMGTTAAMEAAFSVLAIRDQVAPPTINHEVPDPQCDLDCAPNQARPMPIRVAMSNSFGFGGHNASLVFRMFND